MPGAASCQPAAVALPPTRFRAPAEPNASKSAIPEAPVPLGLPPPRVASKAPRRASEDSKASYDAGSSSSCAQKRASDTAPATNRCQVPAGSSQQQQKAPSIMELVNAAARKEEKQEALVRAGICASPRIGSSSRGASPRGAPFFSPFGPSSDYASRDQLSRNQGPPATASRPPVARSPRGQHSSPAGSASATSTPRTSAVAAAAAAHVQHTSAASPRASTAAATAAQAPAVSTSKPPLSPMAGSPGSSRHSAVSLFAQHSSGSSRPAAVDAAAGPAGQQQQQQHVAAAAPQQPSSFAVASAAAAAAAASAPPHAISSSSKGAVPAPLLTGMHSAPPAIGSDCASDDGSLTPEFSICSSASSSSLCSYGSLASSICSTGSRHKSILVRRSVSSSGASSPRGPKHVRWRDGESVREEGGSDLVAVLLLQDTPEIRKLRKDTWPERSKGRDLQELTVTIPIRIGGGSSNSSSSSGAAAASKQTPREDPSAAAAAAAENPLVATVKDWREKLRALSAERRAQRVADMQDTWAARQAAQQRQMLQRQQREEAAATAAAAAAAIAPAAAAETAEVVKPTAAAAAGPVITLQAVAGNISQPVC